jgi:hypothetical protein
MVNTLSPLLLPSVISEESIGWSMGFGECAFFKSFYLTLKFMRVVCLFKLSVP